MPVVMTREEAKAALGHLRGDKWLMASLKYGSGLRLITFTIILALGLIPIPYDMIFLLRAFEIQIPS